MRMLRTFAWALALALAVGGIAHAQEWSELKKQAKAVATDRSKESRLPVIGKLGEIDEPDAVDLLLEIYKGSRAYQEEYRARKETVLRDLEKNPIKDKIQEGGQIQVDPKEYEQYQALKAEGPELEKKLLAEAEVQRAIVEALAGHSGAEAIKKIDQAFGRSKDWESRAALCEALGRVNSSESTALLLEKAGREKEARVLMAAIDALASRKVAAAFDLFTKSLQHETWQVRTAAARALALLGDMKAVDPLIEALRGTDGVVMDEINKALVGLTGVDKHGDPNVWKDWWSGQRDTALGGSYERPAAPAAGDPAGQTTFYGIPVVSKRLCFILDRSGSMAEPADWKPDPTVASGGAAGPDPAKVGDRKIDVARYELKKAILGLQKDVKFNVIFYNHEFTIWQPDTLVFATDENKKKAIAFVESLEPSGQTNIYDPTEAGFRISDDKKAGDTFKGGVDTIYLMSDGMPNAGRIPDAPGIRAGVKELNKGRNVVVNTIAVGKTIDKSFMEGLALDNGGKFVQR